MSWRAISLCSALLAGCVGRALVDDQPVPQAAEKMPLAPCDDLPVCQVRELVLQPPEPLPNAADLPRCAIELPANAELDLRGDEAELRDCRIQLDGLDATRLRLRGARLRNVLIDLSGPVRLELVDGSSLARVQVRSRWDEDAGASLLLEDATATDTHVAVEALEIVRTALGRVFLSTGSTALETSRLRQVSLRAAELQAIATWFADTQLSLDNGTVSASELVTTSVVSGCETLLVAGTSIVESQFAGCRGALRLHLDIVERSVLDGPLEADMSTILESVVGVSALTRLWAWETNVYSTKFCRFSQQARFSNVSLHCAGCEGPFEQRSADVCLAPGEKYDGQPNACPVFERPAECTGAFPARGWPEDVSLPALLPSPEELGLEARRRQAGAAYTPRRRH